MIPNTMTNPSNIERVVMHRVHTIRILRGVFSGTTAACLLLLLTLYGVGREVWVARVFENAPATFTEASRFWLSAFEHTRLVGPGPPPGPPPHPFLNPPPFGPPFLAPPPRGPRPPPPPPPPPFFSPPRGGRPHEAGV